MNKYEAWLMEFVIGEQEGNTTKPDVTILEIDARRGMAEHFGIKLSWAYEIIRGIVERNEHFLLNKITSTFFNGKTRRELEIRYLDDPSTYKPDEVNLAVCDECYEKHMKPLITT